MILICQTAKNAIEKILTGESKNVVWVDNHRDLLEQIRPLELLEGRLVVITSNHFPGENVNAAMLAAGIHSMKSDAWVLLYSFMSVCTGVDGVIDKRSASVPNIPLKNLVDAKVDNSEEFTDLETLYGRFPWIQRPAR